ncbi:pyridine nucleotide-disulfide oxidoreductase [Pseudomonas luteola]|uniref:NAD(P)/FAD-dependent oxidoreductase n=1 Tax=Pseudomonas luteola TaxID=47886 RepID=UPI000F79EE6D|nr:FAD-dependent oxidoreductase [Pseudomonas luteola]RRW40403.1 pyridine nucleotide-disulfide oxidoreductase [Pseudomonas luteola]
MSTATAPIVIVGAGHAGGRAALTLCEEGFAGRIVLIGEEPHLPYERPPLSKGVLQGKATLEECCLFKGDAFDAARIEHLGGVKVSRIDPASHRLELANGVGLTYSKLLLATGGQSRRLVLGKEALSNIFYLRTYEEAVALQRCLASHTRVVVIGGGFIGLEVAASSRKLGCQVTLLEAGPRLASRVLPERISAELLAVHQNKGVDVRLGVRIEELIGESAAEAVRLVSGEVIPCDLVIVGIGMEPNLALAKNAGLETGSGIKVNNYLQTSEPDIYAAGDVCEFRLGELGEFQRQETWRNAEFQGRYAALSILGKQEPFSAIPWFWSDQYEWGLQTIGVLPADAHVVERQFKNDNFILFYLDEQSHLVGASGWGLGNSIAKDVKLCERLIESQVALPAYSLADPSVSLKSLMRH